MRETLHVEKLWLCRLSYVECRDMVGVNGDLSDKGRQGTLGDDLYARRGE